MTLLADPIEAYPSSRSDWERHIRPRVLDRFGELYGRVPAGEVDLTWKVLEEGRPRAGTMRRQIALTCHGSHGAMTVTLLVYLPAQASALPTFLGLNFQGNHTVSTDPEVFRVGGDHAGSTGAIHYDGLLENYPIPPPRGAEAGRWLLPLITGRGYGLITMGYLQIGPDHAGVFDRGLHRTMSTAGLDDRPADAWGSIAMWAWMLCRIQDALHRGMIPEVDASKVAVMGHSRLGKAALWAAAQDNRFAAAISNNSGAMGAALSRPVGETPEVLARIRPYWFSRHFSTQVNGGLPLTVDQHQLIAAIAPRPVYVASASQDPNADPEGEFLSWREATKVWQLYGYRRPECGFPGPGDSRGGHAAPVAYHLRPGPHSVERFDWERWLDFCDRWVSGKRIRSTKSEERR